MPRALRGTSFRTIGAEILLLKDHHMRMPSGRSTCAAALYSQKRPGSSVAGGRSKRLKQATLPAMIGAAQARVGDLVMDGVAGAALPLTAVEDPRFHKMSSPSLTSSVVLPSRRRLSNSLLTSQLGGHLCRNCVRSAARHHPVGA